MTTEPTNDKPHVLDTDQLRAAVLALLERANDTLAFRPGIDTAAEYADQLSVLVADLASSSFELAYATTALRLVRAAALRVECRDAAVRDVFGLEPVAGWEYATDIGTRTFWGDNPPSFPALHLDMAKLIPDEEVPF